MDNSPEKVRIFISYARQDKDVVGKLYSDLAKAGFQPWMDTEDILPGANWPQSLKKAISNAHFFIFCISRNSVDKRGFIQREIKEALDIFKDKLTDDIFIIPVRIDQSCNDMPDSIKEMQRVDLFEWNGFEQIKKSITFQLKRLGIELPEERKESKQRIKEGTKRFAHHDKTSFSVIGRLNNDEIRSIMNHYKAVASKKPEDGDSCYSLALCYLQLKLYDLAIKNFKRSFEIISDFADGYYYYSLSLIRGRRPKTLSLDEVRNIEQYLDTAMHLDESQSKYYFLAAILKYDYYLSNGLAVPPPSHNELLAVANKEDKEYDPWEAERLIQSIILRDDGLISAILRN